MKNGPAMRLTFNYSVGILNNPDSWILPYYDKFTLSSTQTTRQPIKEAYEFITKKLMSGASWAATAIGVGQELSDLFGVKIGSKKFHALSWKEGSQGDFNLQIHLHRGWDERWDSRIEVKNYLQRIMALTVPKENIDINGNPIAMTAPMPAPFDVAIDYVFGGSDGKGGIISGIAGPFGAFGEAVQKTLKDIPLGSELLAAGEGLGQAISGLTGDFSLNVQNIFSRENVQRFKDSAADIAGSGGKWTLELGYYDGTEFKTFYILRNCVVVSSSINFSNEMEESTDPTNPNKKVYSPIEGIVSLTMKTQTIITDTEVYGVK